MTVGMFAGKMIPLHRGHTYVATQASNMCDELYWGLSHCFARDRMLCHREHFKNCTAEQRLIWMRMVAKDMPNVNVFEFEDWDGDNYHSWEMGADAIRAAIGKKIDFVFGSEPSYRKIFEEVHPDAEYILIDAGRDYFPISSTRIREEGPYKHWFMLPDVVRPFFVKKVVIVGTESCGKSTLVKSLARTFDTTYVEEYGRTMCEYVGGIPALEHYPTIAYGHKMKEFEAAKQATRVMFVDTEALTTLYYKHLYTNDWNDGLYREIAGLQDYDLWIYLTPDVEWVDDGLRQNADDRTKQDVILRELLNSFGIKYEVVGGSYQERYMRSLKLVNNLLK
jgi:HTH-type transcriptional regulator, transcriptional repressor of NAD biosynthesis genes